MTGFGQAEDRAKALQAGFDTHLVKPVEADELRRVLAGPDRHRHGCPRRGAAPQSLRADEGVDSRALRLCAIWRRLRTQRLLPSR